MDLGLAGKVALVTAASKGMGLACAMGLAGEGARVVMCARTEADLKAAAEEIRAKTKAEVVAMPADVTKKDDVAALVDRALKTFGGVDILVANAGGPPRGYFEEMSDEQWQGAFDLSLLSVVRLVRGVLPSMKARRWGRILTIQSVSVKQPIPELLLSNAVRYMKPTSDWSERAGVPLGPPSIHRSLNRAMASMMPVMSRKMRIGRIPGSVMCRHACTGLAPSTAAASYRSRGTVCRPARMMIRK